MAKLGKDEFNKKYSEKIVDNDDLLIELMEDVSDSIEVGDSEELTKLKSELDDLKVKYEDLKEKYKERFLSSEEIKEEVKEELIDPEEDVLEEKEVVDIKEI